MNINIAKSIRFSSNEKHKDSAVLIIIKTIVIIERKSKIYI